MPDAGEIISTLRSVLFSHGPGTDEQLLVEHLSFTEIDDHHFDFSNLSQVNSTIIRTFEKVDGITYRQMSRRTFPDDYETGTQIVRVILNGAGQDMKITLQSLVNEGATKSIPGTVRDEIRV